MTSTAHVGWGHSGLSDTLTFAGRVEARRLLLFHHDPLHSDEFLDDFGATAKQAWQNLGRDATELELGMEGPSLGWGPCPGCPRLSGRPSTTGTSAGAETFDTGITT